MRKYIRRRAWKPCRCQIGEVRTSPFLCCRLRLWVRGGNAGARTNLELK